MLRNLRSRRRPRYGVFLCAVVSAILLLLSLSLFHTRLSHSHSHFRSHHHLHRNMRPLHDFNYDSLLSDSVNDDATGGEDTIDALDIVEEQQPTTEDEEDDEPFDHIKVSAGYFFCHIGGVIRRTFNKRSMEEWDVGDHQNGIFLGSGIANEDPSKAAFGSDDIPVDEGVRMKAIQVMGIEDALLLKMGRRVSPLREGWGDWFDKKSDFLRKDKMLRSNLEALNPLHNTILQDPDGVGYTGLTKGDKIVHKGLLHEFKRNPFHVRETQDPKLQGATRHN
ncbi:hypothetical protein Lalb_Chr03g0024651 [Lupinus albus]|uniref:Uncharacterized protein n=1 Tax=Lupinus albus TaxID=3870 RepID=A0A6A4QNW7_LUPAL|nr:hypothetical protein Lalb_Chr03g0024651 [Lupinus albus]